MARKHLDPKADLTFKKVFGEHKNLVISFNNTYFSKINYSGDRFDGIENKGDSAMICEFYYPPPPPVVRLSAE